MDTCLLIFLTLFARGSIQCKCGNPNRFLYLDVESQDDERTSFTWLCETSKHVILCFFPEEKEKKKAEEKKEEWKTPEERRNAFREAGHDSISGRCQYVVHPFAMLRPVAGRQECEKCHEMGRSLEADPGNSLDII